MGNPDHNVELHFQHKCAVYTLPSIYSNNLDLALFKIPNEPIQDFQANIQYHTDNTSMKTLNTVLVTMDLKATIMQWPQRIETAQTTITGQWTNMNFTKIMQLALRTDQ